MDSGETKEEAVVRELREETGMKIAAPNLAFKETLYVRYKSKDFLFHVFHLSVKQKPDITLDKYEHIKFAWFTPDAALKLDSVHDLAACIERHFSVKGQSIACQTIP